MNKRQTIMLLVLGILALIVAGIFALDILLGWSFGMLTAVVMEIVNTDSTKQGGK